MMHFKNILIFSIITILSQFLAKADKLEELIKYCDNNFNGLVIFNYTGYQYYVLNDSRSYDLIILYTGTSQSCQGCIPSTTNYEKIARNYYNQEFKNNPKIIFAIVYVDRVENIMTIHELRNLPAIIYIESTKKFTSNSLTFRRDNQWRIPEQKDISTNAMLGFINKKTGMNITIYISSKEKISRLISLFIGLILITVIFWQLVLLIRRKPFIIMIITIIICSISMSGMVYSIQHGRKQANEFFVRNPRIQNMAEGILVSILMTSASLILFLIPFLFNNKLNFKFFRIPRWLSPLFIAAFVSTLISIHYAYTTKVGWYSPTFYPPDGYLKGPLRVDRGNSF
ncbi:OST3 OST6 family protein [Cryptosporidium andersoni]|uniref:OST3 OST6 family protein n=1 Tax=Cryptosporidium andersoni TaxID=117008 RepID=A0A1J4MWD8_9CRYT|nr:OST3 OST6 family protein [Cryptosporidium andersoni]